MWIEFFRLWGDKLEEKNKTLGAIAIGLIVCVFLAVGYFITNKDVSRYNDEDIFEEEITQENLSEKKVEEVLVDNTNIVETEEKKNLIMVEIKGYVNNPNVYNLEEGSRVYDLIELAGGFEESAYTENLHLAEKLYDEETIIVFSIAEADKMGDNIISVFNRANKINTAIQSQGTSSINESSALININTADKTALMTLNSIGEVTAQKIIDYRDEHGPFKKIEDIKNVSRIGEKTFLNFKDEICVN